MKPKTIRNRSNLFASSTGVNVNNIYIHTLCCQYPILAPRLDHCIPGLITLTKQPLVNAMLPESGAGAPEAIEPTRSAIRQAGKDELAEYFANPRVSGIALAEWEARYIASGNLARLTD